MHIPGLHPFTQTDENNQLKLTFDFYPANVLPCKMGFVMVLLRHNYPDRPHWEKVFVHRDGSEFFFDDGGDFSHGWEEDYIFTDRNLVATSPKEWIGWFDLTTCSFVKEKSSWGARAGTLYVKRKDSTNFEEYQRHFSNDFTGLMLNEQVKFKSSGETVDEWNKRMASFLMDHFEIETVKTILG